MQAVIATKTGPAAEVLSIRNVPMPQPQANEVRVQIATSGINPSDVKRRGAAPAGSALEFPEIIPHSDGAGTIDAVGAGVSPLRIGERVWLYNAQWQRPYGTAAEYCVVPAAYAVPLPAGIDFAAAASFGIPALTAYHAIHIDGPVSGMTLLVQGGAGAVAFYATQFAKAAGATVIATVSSAEKAAYARRAGADYTIDYKTEDRQARVTEITGGRRVDRIIEVDVAANALSYPGLLAEYGKAVVYGSGAPIAQIPATFIRWSTTLQFFIVYQLHAAERAAAIAGIDTMLRANSLDHGEIRRFPFERAVEAHEAVETGSLGNVVLEFPAGR
jgi:NADPH2:quinone reductase